MADLRGSQLLEALLAARLLTAEGGQIGFRHEWFRAHLAGSGAPAARPEHESDPWAEKVVIGLTGNIATGKSAVLAMLAALGAQAIDADRLVHQLRQPGAPGYAPLVQALGQGILHPDGRVNVAALAERAFNDPATLARLEQIFRPLVVAEVERMVHESDQRIIVIEAIKLLEGSLKDRVDAVWVVDASRERQIARLMAGRKLSREQAVARIEAQNPQADKLAQADVIIRNDGDLHETHGQVLGAWAGVLAQVARIGSLDTSLIDAWLRACLERAHSPMPVSLTLSALARLAQIASREPSLWLSRDRAVALLDAALESGPDKPEQGSVT